MRSKLALHNIIDVLNDDHRWPGYRNIFIIKLFIVIVTRYVVLSKDSGSGVPL